MSKVSENISQNQKSNKISSMVRAMRGWETSLASSNSRPGGKFGRVVRINVAGLTITNAMDIEFNVPFDDDTEVNEAEITIYNLSRQTIALLKANSEISIIAGYGSDTGVIFTGMISTVKSKWSNQDKVTTIKAIDDTSLTDRDVVSMSFTAGTKAHYILRMLVNQLKLPVVVFEPRKNHTYTEAVTVSGGLMSNIKQYAEVCGVSVYINKRKVYVRYLADGDDTGITVDVDSGLIGSPEEFTEEVDNEDYTETIRGMKFKILLEHRITTGSFINLKSRDYSGRYRVREGQHVCTDSDFYTEITAIE